ncbi:MAG: integration host factor subunit alpha [Deltaproteobacteria bacterium]|nr:integration host factor subunit alpha [Deltaproteobacteria bacterium]
MTMTKDHLARRVLEEVRLRKRNRSRQRFLFPELLYQPLTRRRASGIVGSLFEIIKRALEKGDDVLISGFGRFQVKFKWARKGRNPRTGEQIVLDSRRIVTFRPSTRLKHRTTENLTEGRTPKSVT